MFLHNITSVEFDFQGSARKITVAATTDNEKRKFVNVTEGENLDEWETLVSPRDAKNIIALKTSQGGIISARPEESVFHSFTPTTEFAGAFLKINGDYSTDPSRKNLDMDEHSQSSFADAVTLLAETIVDLLSEKTIRQGFLAPFINAKQGVADRSKPQLLSSLADCLRKMPIHFSIGQSMPFESLRLRPEWLSYEDYEQLCQGKIAPVSKSLLRCYPEISAFLEQLNVPPLTIREIMDNLNLCDLSPLGYAQVFTKLVKQFRYSLDAEKVQEIKTLRIFPVSGQVVSPTGIKSTAELNKEFLQFVLNNNDAPDLKLFWSKIGVTLGKEVQDAVSARPVDIPTLPSTASTQSAPLPQGFKSQPNLKKWRSAEQNAEEYIRALDGVSSVTDMSKANLGYDLEVVLDNGRRLYAEVKSVSSFSEPFRLTNNEYSSAHHYGDDYMVAVVINGEPFQIMIIRNPVEKVELHKQCERWSWYCENYQDQLNSISAMAEAEKE